MMKKIFSLAFALLCAAVSFADPAPQQLNLLLTQGSGKARPIEVVPFANDPSIANIIIADLNLMGEFKISDPNTLPAQLHQFSEVTKAKSVPGVEAVVVGSVLNGQVNFSLVDLVKGSKPELLAQQAYPSVPENQKRALAHHISDVIYEKLTGVKGIFSTRIAYVQTSAGSTPTYFLMVSDVDGQNPHAVLTSQEPIMSPAWSPDGKQLAYVSFEGRKAAVYVTTLATAARTKVSDEPGINGAPAWSPDGRKLALALSRGKGHPDIFILDLGTKQLTAVTQDGSINTEPNFSPNGRDILFTSDRSGSPQIYNYDLATHTIKRLSYTGNYNARASHSSDGKKIVMINRGANGYNIAMQDLQTGLVKISTDFGRADSPSLAPNSKIVLYGTERGELGIASVNGQMKLRIPASNGSKVQDPAWGPLTQH